MFDDNSLAVETILKNSFLNDLITFSSKFKWFIGSVLSVNHNRIIKKINYTQFKKTKLLTYKFQNKFEKLCKMFFNQCL